MPPGVHRGRRRPGGDRQSSQPVIESTTGLVTTLGPNLGDVRNDSTKSVAGAWYTVPGRTLSFVKRYPASMSVEEIP